MSDSTAASGYVMGNITWSNTKSGNPIQTLGQTTLASAAASGGTTIVKWERIPNVPNIELHTMMDTVEIMKYAQSPNNYKGTKNKIEGVEIMKLYDVVMVYAESRKDPVIVAKKYIIAKDAEDAKIKSGLMKEVDEKWDADYLTFIVSEIGEVKVKEKPKEVKTIA